MPTLSRIAGGLSFAGPICLSPYRETCAISKRPSQPRRQTASAAAANPAASQLSALCLRHHLSRCPAIAKVPASLPVIVFAARVCNPSLNRPAAFCTSDCFCSLRRRLSLRLPAPAHILSAQIHWSAEPSPPASVPSASGVAVEAPRHRQSALRNQLHRPLNRNPHLPCA